jgi:3-oxoacyl-[acyl-carrier protein] reductase
VDLRLQGRTAIVCGASSGMGLATAEALAEEGANVAMFARRRELLESEAERLGALAVRGDLTIPADLERLVQRTVAAFGGIDVLVLNGGGPPTGRAADIEPEQVEQIVELLLVPFVGLTRLCLPYLGRSGQGRVILIESTSVKQPIDNLALSNTVRPGVVGWAKTLSREVGAQGVTVNTVAPGRIDTERVRELYGGEEPPPEALAEIPLGRLGGTQEVADVICFLVSGRASYVSGTVVSVDGGAGRSLL